MDSMTIAEMFGYLKNLGISRIFLQGFTDDNLKYQCCPYGIVVAIRYAFNPLEHTAGCQTVETSMSFACNSSFLSVDGMTCLIPFES